MKRNKTSGIPDELDGRCRVVIEGVSPEIDAGAFAIKRVVGDRVIVEADVFGDGHDAVTCRLLFKAGGAEHWSDVPMMALGNDRWRGQFPVDRVGPYVYTVEGWVDHFLSWRRDLDKRVAARQVADVDLAIGAVLVGAAATRATGVDRRDLESAAAALAAGTLDERLVRALHPALSTLVARYPDRTHATRYARELPVWVDRRLARFSTWYEMFPRSCGEPGRHGTFADCERRLDYVKAMGFDVVYLPPIHPVGRAFRKGKNNTLDPGPDDVGSPWAIGAAEGGHTAVHPELGTIDDFRRLVVAARARDMEMALDIAFQCSPDHPWVTEHPEFFRQRPDGTIQYAENPPKKYQDIYPLDFESVKWRELWQSLHDVIVYWVEQGVQIFRVDNPHTKAFPFWQWVIGAIKAKHPDVLFLSEAFTRPKVMYRLAKLGFTQSYTYFTWRNTKAELTEYFTELTRPPVREFFRPNPWPNTPDILHETLQTGGRPAFMARLALAATLGASYGIYGPAFELGESAPREPGSEEYLHSEKYEIRHRPLDSPWSLKDYIARINQIRRENPALQDDWSLRFHETDNDLLICYSKATADGDNVLVVVVNLDPRYVQRGWISLDLAALGLADDRPFQAHELVGEGRYLWQGRRNYVELDPHQAPAQVFRLRQKVRTERDFDYYL